MKTPYLDEEIKYWQDLKDTEGILPFEDEKLDEFKAIKQALSLSDVVQQRELLEAFKHILEMKYGNLQFDDYDIECFIKGLQ